MPTLAAAGLLLLTALGPGPSGWRVAAAIPGVFDVAGPRPDGRLVVAGSEGLWLLDAGTGATARFAPAYAATGGFEAYIAVVPARSGCFTPGDVFALAAHRKGGVTRVGEGGSVSAFATVPAVDGLSGIGFDVTGRFGERLLVFGGHAGKTTVVALDCRGRISTVTTQAPVAEGGAAVAPASFGAFAGDLVLTDELSGHVYAVAPDGSVATIATPPLAHGGDIGVEGAGFVPPGDVAAGQALFADRVTPGSPHPGSDYLLAAPGSLLLATGVHPGDLLVATEGGAALDAIRCAAACAVTQVIPANGSSHGEGHVLVWGGPASSRAPGTDFGRAPAAPLPLLQLLVLGLALVAFGLLGLRIRAARGR